MISCCVAEEMAMPGGSVVKLDPAGAERIELRASGR